MFVRHSAPPAPSDSAPRHRGPDAGTMSGTMSPADQPDDRSRARALLIVVVAAALLALVLWQAITVGGNPDPTAPRTGFGAGVLDIGVLVFREGLECILVLAAVTASLVGSSTAYRRPIAAGVGVAFIATLITWTIAVGIIDNLTESFSALQVQAVTGLIAIIVLLVVMNWFFHKVYWTGWISAHTRRKKELMKQASGAEPSRTRILWGFAMLGFTSLYREGFEVVLFLQTYRLKLGGRPVLYGVLIGSGLSIAVALLTFVANRRLPYKRMLVITGVMLGAVLLVMVGEQAQEMQLAHWLPTTPIPSLARVIPSWMGLWFAIFPTVETLAAQGLALLLVVGSYAVVRIQLMRQRERSAVA